MLHVYSMSSEANVSASFRHKTRKTKTLKGIKPIKVLHILGDENTTKGTRKKYVFEDTLALILGHN
ncbi:hypothetical protein GsuE55_18400 [Geobacillus subterraneus]|uniref:Uncharacterized protein n=1 Tax=Geobacillus subterraneus TaxID=129338 RepID=A0A679FRW2_9BACL|nr:hypothetical protein GsuE55_18400 [Geobacillus subterraneus]